MGIRYVQGLVYIFIAAVSIAIAGTAYFGLTFTLIESFLAGVLGLSFALFLLERTLRRREQSRLERSIQDLSRLLSTDAKAGHNLSQRLNELVDQELEPRVDVLEADVSVLGTVVRELAETLADLEKRKVSAVSQEAPKEDGIEVSPQQKQQRAEPVIPAEVLRQALTDDRLIHHMQPIITLPERLTHGYDLVPRLKLEGEELAKGPDFMPIKGSADLVSQIEAMALMDAVTIARRAKTAGEPVAIYVPLSEATLADKQARNQMMAILDANRAIADLIGFLMSQDQWTKLQKSDAVSISAMKLNGVGFSLRDMGSLRVNYSELRALGVKSVRADARIFIDNPAHYTDFHTADIAAYVSRFEVDLIMSNVTNEQQVLTLLDDGIRFAQGPYLAKDGPIRSDLLAPDDDFLAVNLSNH